MVIAPTVLHCPNPWFYCIPASERRLRKTRREKENSWIFSNENLSHPTHFMKVYQACSISIMILTSNKNFHINNNKKFLYKLEQEQFQICHKWLIDNTFIDFAKYYSPATRDLQSTKNLEFVQMIPSMVTYSFENIREKGNK